MKKGVQKIYGEVAPRYDLINRLMTMGLDVLWRKKAARTAVRFKPRRILDVCCGTGDMSRSISRYTGGQTRIIGVDFSPAMLDLASTKQYATPVSFVLSDVNRLPFSDGTFDLLAISFATRNIDSGPSALIKYFREFHRVLKPQGVLVHLETSQPRNRLLRTVFHGYVRYFVKPLGIWVSGSAPGYRYLAHTIPRFYAADELSSLLDKAGFRNVTRKSLMRDMAALHVAHKIVPEEKNSRGPARQKKP